MSGWLIFVSVVAALAVLAYLLGRWQRRSEERGIDRRKRKAGKKAEDDVSSELSRLAGRGLYYVFNNLKDAAPGARGDIDHLVVGPAGIVVVETKGDPGVVTADFSQNPPLLLHDGRPFVSGTGGRPRSFLAQLDGELREVHRNVLLPYKKGAKSRPWIEEEGLVCFTRATLAPGASGRRPPRTVTLDDLVREITSRRWTLGREHVHGLAERVRARYGKAPDVAP